MGGAPTPKMVPLVLTHSHFSQAPVEVRAEERGKMCVSLPP